MTAYIIRRLFQLVIVLIGVTFITFMMLKLVPGDPAVALAGKGASQQRIEFVRHERGLDRPFYVQYYKYVARLLHGDLGESLYTGLPVADMIRQAAPVTIQLAIAAVLIEMLGIPLGVYSALRQYSFWDTTLTTLALIIWGPLPVSLPSPVHGAPLRFSGVVISMHQLFIFATLTVVLLLQFLLLTRTRFGILMQATAQDLHTARLVGIPVNRTIAVAFAFGAMLSGIAGLLVAPIFLAEPTMGGSLGLKGFVVSVIGGFGNLPGAVIGGLFLGLIETFGARYISSNFRDAYAFIVMIAVLVAWPRGLFGEKSSEKV